MVFLGGSKMPILPNFDPLLDFRSKLITLPVYQNVSRTVKSFISNIACPSDHYRITVYYGMLY